MKCKVFIVLLSTTTLLVMPTLAQAIHPKADFDQVPRDSLSREIFPEYQLGSQALKHSPSATDRMVATDGMVSESIDLPPWLNELNLTSEQTRQLIIIDAMLAQQLEAILTAEQYSQLQDSFADGSTQLLSIHELDLGLSLYQQAAIDTAFQDSMQHLLSILSDDQRQQFFQNLREEQPTPDGNFSI